MGPHPKEIEEDQTCDKQQYQKISHLALGHLS